MEKERPSYLKAKRRTKEEVKVITDSYIMNNELSKIGIGKKYHLITYGCQANVRDSETIAAILEDMSFTSTNNKLIIIFIIFFIIPPHRHYII